MIDNFLEAGEFQYGCYKVQYVDWQEQEWSGTGFWLQATVTNKRLLVYPELGVYPQDYETIQPTDIMKVWNVSLRGKDGILIRLRDGRCLHLLVDWSQGSKLVRDIDKMLVTPVKPRISPRLI
ncbi:MAG: hypothetical protein LCI00_20540 [Chloroflexi bacterium]|nr:hypothetical protein [Chloroflexota bacterium]MCC6892503.1 hypothetical protein [Anaerolineae bacterium]